MTKAFRDVKRGPKHSEVAVSQSSLRVVTYNIRKGKGASGRADGSIEGLGTALLSQRPDLLLCQEVFHSPARELSQSTELGDILALRPYYEPNRRRRNAHYGNATLTHLPVSMAQNHDISTNPLEKRGVFYIRTSLGGRPLHVFNAHLGLNQRQRRVQVERIVELIDSLCLADDGVLLAGDFNDWTRNMDRILRQEHGFTNPFAHIKGRESLTWHSRRPVFNLDRVYLRNVRATHVLRLSGQPWDILSDHLPLAAELHLSAAAV